MFTYYFSMKSVGSTFQSFCVKFFLIHNLSQGREPCKFFRIHTFYVVPLRNLLFPLNYSYSMPPLSGSFFFPYILHLNKNWIYKNKKQKSFQHDILVPSRFKIKVTSLLSLIFIDLPEIFIIDYKNYINKNLLKI